MKTAFSKEVLRTIRKAPGRFIAIALIVAIGCGFFAGLRMSGVGMRKAADAFFNDYNFYNFELVSEGGISQAIIDDVSSLDNIVSVQAQKQIDVVTTFETERYGVRIVTLPQNGINNLKLESGRWPEKADECVVLDSRVDKLEQSDTLTVTSGDSENDIALAEQIFHVVGTVMSPEYTYSTNLGPTTVGSGILQQVLYVPNDAFHSDYPYTNLYIADKGGYDSFNDEEGYEARTSEVLSALDSKLETFSEMRGDELRQKAQDELDKKSAQVFFSLTRLPVSAQAEQKKRLQEAQAEIDSIDNPSFYVLERKQNYGAQSYLEDSKRIDSIATVFPLIFFLVAALVALTTMTRMVEDDRELIGTHKALGYQSSLIAGKYLIYAAAASIIGATVGILILSQVLPGIIFSSYAIAYAIPARPFPLPIEPVISIVSLILGAAVTILSTLAACITSAKETPAALMRERAPKPGKRIFLERISIVWRHLSFINKVTLRNIFRYKKRLFMTLVGIAGCSALLLTGIGIRDSINDIIDKQFGAVFTYNTIVGLEKGVSKDDLTAVSSYISEQPDVQTSVELHTENMAVQTSNNTTASIQLISPEHADSLSKVVNLQERQTQCPIAFNDFSCVLTEKIATTLGSSKGDTLTLYETDTVGNRTKTSYTVTITDISENYVNSYLYMGPTIYKSTLGKIDNPNTFWVWASEDDAFQDAFANHLQHMQGVTTVIFNDETIDLYRSLLKTMDAVMGVLIGAAALLACVVLYNLTNINIAERKKEIATLKVLGFKSKEIAGYIYKEIGLLVVLGALLGLVLGILLESYVIVTVERESLMFSRGIHPSVFLVSFLLTLLFAAGVLLFMLFKLKAVDMVESLKPGE